LAKLTARIYNNIGGVNGGLWPFALISVAKPNDRFGEDKPPFLLHCDKRR
jgi:hypothetical protein